MLLEFQEVCEQARCPYSNF